MYTTILYCRIRWSCCIYIYIYINLKLCYLLKGVNVFIELVTCQEMQI